MSGTYNYHPNIAHQGAFNNNQTASHQVPFYFGGAQTPINLGLPPQVKPMSMSGQGFKSTTHHLFRERGNLIPTSSLRK